MELLRAIKLGHHYYQKTFFIREKSVGFRDLKIHIIYNRYCLNIGQMIDDGIKGCRILETKTITLENDLGEEFVERTRKRTSANCTMVSQEVRG